MPRLLLSLIFLLSLPAAAQDLSPVVVNRAELNPHLFNNSQGFPADTIAPWRYYPLAVGNAWEYQNQNGETMRIDIRRDSVIDGQVYYNWHRMFYDPQGIPHPGWEISAFIRFDTTSAYVVTPDTGYPYFIGTRCRFDAQPGEDLECEGEFGGWVSGMTYEGVLAFGDTTVTDVPVKQYSMVDAEHRFAADFGLVWAWEKDGHSPRGLTFARINGHEYGQEWYPVAGEPGFVENTGLAVEAIWPNPAQSSLAVQMQVPNLGPLRISIYDLLGREVLRREHLVDHQHSVVTLNLESLPVGHYIARLTSTGQTTRGVRFVRMR
jgi:hypothetical protein